MGVDALGLVVLRQVERAELGFVVKQVEVFVFAVVVNELCLDLLLAMGERAEISVRTLSH